MLHRSVHYSLPADRLEQMSSLEITALADGPYRVEGDVTLLDRDEQPIPNPGSPVHLCRFGRSASKSLCDGSHARTGWTEDA